MIFMIMDKFHSPENEQKTRPWDVRWGWSARLAAAVPAPDFAPSAHQKILYSNKWIGRSATCRVVAALQLLVSGLATVGIEPIAPQKRRCRQFHVLAILKRLLPS
jgi:hypothetical protein